MGSKRLTDELIMESIATTITSEFDVDDWSNEDF